MSNKPIAWIDLRRGGIVTFDAVWASKVDDKKPIPLYTHPVKKLHLSLQKDKETGELLAVTYTDDEHRIVEVLWQKSPVKEHFEDEPQAEELHEILKSYNEPLNYEVTHPRWSKEKEFFANWNYPQKTYEDGIEECAQRAESYAYMSPNFTALAEELRAILRKAQEP